MVLAACLLLTLADSVHFRSLLPPAAGAPAGSVAYDARVQSLLDVALRDLVQSRESTYSRPLAFVGFTKESSRGRRPGRARVAPRLLHGGAHLSDPGHAVARRPVEAGGRSALVVGAAAAALLCAC